MNTARDFTLSPTTKATSIAATARTTGRVRTPTGSALSAATRHPGGRRGGNRHDHRQGKCGRRVLQNQVST